MTVETVEQFWARNHGENSKWRRARKPGWCGECRTWAIEPGDRYLDTGEHIGYYKTSKCCEQCAVQPVTFTEEGASAS